MLHSGDHFVELSLLVKKITNSLAPVFRGYLLARSFQARWLYATETEIGYNSKIGGRRHRHPRRCRIELVSQKFRLADADGLACCAIELMAVAPAGSTFLALAPKSCRFSPRQSDCMSSLAPVTYKMAGA